MTTAKSVKYIFTDSLLQLALQAPELKEQAQNTELQQGILNILVPAIQAAIHRVLSDERTYLEPYFDPNHNFKTDLAYRESSAKEVAQYIDVLLPELFRIFSHQLSAMQSSHVKVGLEYLMAKIGTPRDLDVKAQRTAILNRAFVVRDWQTKQNTLCKTTKDYGAFFVAPYALQLALSASFVVTQTSREWTRFGADLPPKKRSLH